MEAVSSGLIGSQVVLVCEGCHNKLPQTRCLQQKKLTVTVWRPEFKIVSLFGLSTALFSLYLHMLFPLYCLALNFLFHTRFFCTPYFHLITFVFKEDRGPYSHILEYWS
jgi:hypothetical protein